MATYVVGDLQGCYRELDSLLTQVRFDPAKDLLWLTGDLVNRGPQSLACLRLVKSLGKAAQTVLGNHDLHLLAVALTGASPKKKDTLQEIIDAADAGDLLAWLRQQPLMVVDNARQLALCHAGIYPAWTIPQARALAGEVEVVLQSADGVRFLQQMYGNEPDHWDASHTGFDRLRFITNAFTRMRICSTRRPAAPSLELRFKEGVASIPAGYTPWFTQYVPPPGWRILFGHWAALEAHTGIDSIIALDSGCIWGRHMTMLRIDDGQFFYSV